MAARRRTADTAVTFVHHGPATTFTPHRASRYQLTARVVVLEPSGLCGVTSSVAIGTAAFTR